MPDTDTMIPTAEEVIAEPTEPSEVETPVEEAVEDSTEVVETSSLFDEYDLDELAKTDPKLRAFYQKASDWGKARAQKSYQDQLESEKSKARQKAEEEALSAQYNSAVESARQVLGNKAAQDMASVINYIAENGVPKNWDTKAFVDKMASDLFSSTNVVMAVQLAEDRRLLLEKEYPNHQYSQSVVSAWTKALQKRDPKALDEAYRKAVDEAARASVKAELQREAEAKAAENAKAKEKVEELERTEEERSGPRPTSSVPVKGRKLMTPEELDAIPTNQWLKKPQEERDELIRQANQVQQQRARRTA